MKLTGIARGVAAASLTAAALGLGPSPASAGDEDPEEALHAWPLGLV